MRALVRRRPFASFLVLAFLLSWYPWLIALARGTTTGPNPLGPLVAGAIVVGVADGRRALGAFLARIVRWRVGWRWYVAAFAVPIAIAAAATVVALRGSVPAEALAAAVRGLPEPFLFILLFIGLGEEPGWRGFAHERLRRERGPLAAALAVAPIWALWHLPLLGTEFPWPRVPAFLVGLVGATFFLAWLYDGSGGSVLLPMLAHAATNAVGAGVLFPLVAEADAALWWWTNAGLWLLVAAAVATGWRRRSARRDPAEVGAPA